MTLARTAATSWQHTYTHTHTKMSCWLFHWARPKCRVSIPLPASAPCSMLQILRGKPVDFKNAAHQYKHTCLLPQCTCVQASTLYTYCRESYPLSHATHCLHVFNTIFLWYLNRLERVLQYFIQLTYSFLMNLFLTVFKIMSVCCICSLALCLPF